VRFHPQRCLGKIPVSRSAVLCLAVWALLALTLLGLTGTPPRAVARTMLPMPAGWPLDGPVKVLRGFDPPATPWGRGHRGVDLAARVGDRVLAAAAGTVTVAGPVAGSGVVVVDHGLVRSTYEPVSALVSVGSRVRQGDLLGIVAAGSHCDGTPCLHWGLLHGHTYLNPLDLIASATSVRLVPAAQRAIAVQRSAARAAVAGRAARIAQSRVARASVAPTAGASRAARHGFLFPVPGRITSGYGMRLHPILKVWKLHDGTDFGAACGTPIRAAFSGRVVRSYFSPGYGNRLIIDHGVVDGQRVRTGYNHALGYSVGVGAAVSRGQTIGAVGSTGSATGCHLHLMVWLNDRLRNPMSWF
jgi:murein DD-endopeptidase MepM/ murein hydrolase activator NlpD